MQMALSSRNLYKWYHLDEGDVCHTNGKRVYSRADGYDWVQLEDGGWVAAHLLGI